MTLIKHDSKQMLRQKFMPIETPNLNKFNSGKLGGQKEWNSSFLDKVDNLRSQYRHQLPTLNQR
jgi:hypothetical protein